VLDRKRLLNLRFYALLSLREKRFSAVGCGKPSISYFLRAGKKCGTALLYNYTVQIKHQKTRKKQIIVNYLGVNIEAQRVSYRFALLC